MFKYMPMVEKKNTVRVFLVNLIGNSVSSKCHKPFSTELKHSI